MPPAAKKNASVILYDVNCEREFQTTAKECLMSIFATKWFSESKDVTKLILVNTLESNNNLHNKFKKAPHICEVTGVISYDPKLIHSHLEGKETAQGDWLVALAVAIDEIKDNYVDDTGVTTIQILFITDFFSQPVELKEKRVQFIISSLNTLNIFLYVIGPKVKILNQLSTIDDVKQWSKNVKFVHNSDNSQLRIIKNIVKSTNNSIVCDLDLGKHLFVSFKNNATLQPWLVPLSAGTNIIFPSVTTRFLRPVQPPKVRAQNYEKDPWTWRLIDDVMVEVDFEDVIGGVFRHGKFIPLSISVEKNFKYYSERAFKLVGFVDRSNISDVHMIGEGSSYVKSDSKKFSLLLHTLADKNMCAIARRISVKNSCPKLVALLPKLEENAFILVQMPYLENISFEVIEHDINEAPGINETTTTREVYDYLSRLDVTNPVNNDDNNSVKFPLAPTLMNPIRCDLMHQFLLKKYIGEDVNIIQEHPVQVTDTSSYLHLCPPRTSLNDDNN